MATLGPLLEKEGHYVRYASNKKNKVLRLCDMLFKVLRYSRTVNIVLIDTYSTQNFYYALLVSQLCRWCGLPYIPVLHGGNLPQRLMKSPRMSSLIFRNAKINVAPSAYLKEQFELNGFNNVEYVPNTIELSNYQFFKRTFDKPRLLWVRSFSKIYNPLMAIQVLKQLKESALDASLCMVGPDADGTFMEAKNFSKELGLNVKFTGKLPKQEWLELSKDYNVFINTTNIDNTPVSVIEAMALGLPVVSTNVGGMPYLIENGRNGILVEPNETDEMVQAIISLFDDISMAETLVLNARMSSELYDWQSVRLKWNEILRN